ncbi:MAG: hypothetical protein GYA55_13550 [SAR324 cluster bacterium]|uniref:Calcineurin-like phosphoesterase domain-containing protein n=1 Tax=SAR324 cluster bacterium TaxID=2024889 RepID=A0A7X9ILI0_9DELT|nr:hypothetical protein [SAR324 cluster bacterium]
MHYVCFHVIAACIFLLSSCGGSPENFPEILSTNPENESGRCSLTTSISVNFANQIIPENISSETFTVRDDDGNYVQGLVSYSLSDLSAKFSPYQSLKKNTKYIAELHESILGRKYSWSFSTYGFIFIVMSDTHIRIPGAPDNQYYDSRRNEFNLVTTISYINERFPTADFVVVTGDLVGTLYSTNLNHYGVGKDTPVDRFKSLMNKLSMPFFVALGNHDYLVGFDTNAGEAISAMDWQIPEMEAVWQKVLEIPPFYLIEHEGLHFYFLNSVTGSKRGLSCPYETRGRMCQGSFSSNQMEWLEQNLASGAKSFLFFHHPIRTPGTSPFDWTFYGDSYMVDQYDEFYSILSKHLSQILAIFVGHGHSPMKGNLENGSPVFETPSTGDLLGSANAMYVVNVFPDTGEISIISPQEFPLH